MPKQLRAILTLYVAKGGRTAGGEYDEIPGGIDDETVRGAVGVEFEQGRVGIQPIRQNCCELNVSGGKKE
jgi:hypothetical protein